VDSDRTLCRCGHPKASHELHDRFDERLWCNDCPPLNLEANPLHIFKPLQDKAD
jgi:hypothetical protein